MKKHLERELETYQQELRRLDERLKVKGDYGHGTADPRIVSWELDMYRRHRVSKEIDLIISALENSSSDSYGICRFCRKKIDPERLSVLPCTTVCIECARAGNEEKGTDIY